MPRTNASSKCGFIIAVLSIVLIVGGQGQDSQQATAGARNTTTLPTACQALQSLGFKSNLPIVVIQLVNTSQVAGASVTQLQLLAKGPHLPGLLTTCGTPDGGDVNQQPVRLHVRGSSSAVEYAKKSFSLDPVDQIADFRNSETEQIRFLGLPEEKDWILHGPENDRTLGMRSWIGYNMARWMGRYASRTQYFELFLNTDPATSMSMEHYRGIYMLQEKFSRGKNRVNVNKFDANVDPSGGYLLAYENDNSKEGDVTLVTKLSKLDIKMISPKTNNQSVVMWIQQWMNNFESQLVSQPVSNLANVLDVPAAIDYFIITEITKNPDGYRGSIKMHKDRGGPLVLGPIWDLNEAFGLCCGYPIEGYQASGASNGTSGGSAISSAGWRFNICQDPGRCRIEPADGISQWYRRLWQDATFRTAAAARWQELRNPSTGALRDAVFINEISTIKAQLGSGPGTAGQRNYDKWSAALNVPGFGVQFKDWTAMFDYEVKVFTDWLLARLKWLDAAFAAQASPEAGPAAYLSVGYVVAEPPVAGPARVGPNGMPAVAGR